MANYTYQFYGPTSYEAIRWRSNSKIQEVFDNWHGGQASHSDHYFDVVVEYEGQETVNCSRYWINDSNEFNFIGSNPEVPTPQNRAQFYIPPMRAGETQIHAGRQYCYAQAYYNDGDWNVNSYFDEWLTTTYTGLFSDSVANAKIIVFRSTAPVSFNDQSVDNGDQFYADANQDDTIGITFGVYCDTGSNQNVPSETNIVPYYYTGKYNIGLDFTTAEVVIDGVVRRPATAYSLDTEDMMAILGENGYQAVDQKYELSKISLSGIPLYHLYAQYRSGLGYTQGIQGYDDAAPLMDLEIEDLNWDDFDQYKSINSFTLAQVKQYMIEQEMDVENLTDNAMYVPYTVKFYNESGTIVYENVVDFSSLHDSGVDLEGNGGGNTEWENSTDGTKPEDQLDRVGKTPLGNPSLSTLGCFSNLWFMNKTELLRINSLLNDPDQYDWDDVKRGLALMGEDPYRAFVDVRMYPFDVAALNAGRTRTGNVAIGGYVSTISSVYLSGNPVGVKRLGGKKIEPYYKNYLDYAPYTEYILYVPYVGFMELDPTMITNTYLTIDLALDISTGACCVIVCADGKVVSYRQGTIGVSVPLSSNTSVQVAQKDASTMFGDIAMLLGGLISENPIPAIAGGIGLTKDISEAIFRPREVRIGGTSCSNPTCNAYLPQSIYLYRIVSEPALPEEDWDAYGKTNGWAVAKKDRVGSYTADSGIIHAKLTSPGAVAVNNIGTNCPKITQPELDEIERILAEGFYGRN